MLPLPAITVSVLYAWTRVLLALDGLIARFRGGNEDPMCRGYRVADPFPAIPLSWSILRSILKGD